MVSYKVVIWGLDESAIDTKMIKPKAKVKLLGVRGKQNQQDLEIHGNESTKIVIDEDDKISGPMTLRIISISSSERGERLGIVCGQRQDALLFNGSINTLQRVWRGRRYRVSANQGVWKIDNLGG